MPQRKLEMNETAQLLTKPTNYAVVHLPGRRFPGVVVQGDSLHSHVRRLAAIQSMAAKYCDEELNAGISERFEIFSQASKHFEKICNEHGISLPYPVSANPR